MIVVDETRPIDYYYVTVPAEITSRLADSKVNITSVQTFCAGGGRYGGMLWVKPADLRKAAKVLGIG